MPDTLKILMLEDDTTDAELVHNFLTRENLPFEFNLTLNKEAFLHALDHFAPDIILIGNSVPHFGAKEALCILRQRSPPIPFLSVSHNVSEELGVINAAISQQRAEKERKLALECLRKSDDRFQTLSKATKDAIWDWDLRTDVIWWNESFYRLVGFDQHQPVPDFSRWTKRIHTADRNKVMARINGIKKNEICSWADEFRLKLFDGTYTTVLDRGYILKDEAGEPVRVIGVLVNISEQKRLIREMEILSMIPREASNCVMLFNRNKGITTWVNEGFARYTGYLQEELIGIKFWSLLGGPDTDQAICDFIRRQLVENLPFTRDLLIYTKTKDPKWLCLSGHSIYHGDPGGSNYFVIATDITERRKIEEEEVICKMERQNEITRAIMLAEETERDTLGRELHDNINQILAAINLKLSYYMDEPENNLDIIEDCRRNLKKAIEEARNLSHRIEKPRFREKTES